jgi:TRAP-type C4-dicarboxylate transport system substrate-binding protein
MTPFPNGIPLGETPSAAAAAGSRSPLPRRWSRRPAPALAVVALCLAAAMPASAGKVEVKLASLVPENSPWYTLLKDMNTEWQKVSGGDVSIVIYPGGVAGDESDIIRKMGIGQLHAGALTVGGLSDLDDYFSVFSIPLFFQSWDEFNFVLDDLTPLLVDRLDKKGFVWLTWGHVGWVYFFTKAPVERVDDLRKLKIFTWAGDDRMVQWWKRNGFSPVALSVPDALQGLKTGLIETMISPPLAALTLQWFKETPYMIDIGMVPMVGAVVIDKRTWNRIDEKQRAPLLAAAGRIGGDLQRKVPGYDQFAITTMQNQGLKVLEIKNSPHSAEWLAEATKFADEMRGDMVPAEIFDRALKRRNEFRAQHSSQQNQPAATGTAP